MLATDQSTETTTTEDGRTVVRAFRTVTMEVTPRIAEKIAVAQTIGTLSLSLRSIADNQAELERAIAEGEVDLPDDASAEEEERLLRMAMSRPGEGATTFQTGGDVSRFQRSTVPPRRGSNNRPSGNADNGPQYAPGVSANATPSGPTVRVTRGKATTITPVSAGAGALLDRQAGAMGEGARVGSIGMSTVR